MPNKNSAGAVLASLVGLAKQYPADRAYCSAVVDAVFGQLSALGDAAEKLLQGGDAGVANAGVDAVLLEIAKKHLFVETLETRRSDELDFHDVHVGNIRRALREAYAAGASAAVGRLFSVAEAPVLPVSDGTVRKGDMVWWLCEDGPMRVNSAAENHWRNISEYPECYALRAGAEGGSNRAGG